MFAQSTKMFVSSHPVSLSAIVVTGFAAATLALSMLFNSSPAHIESAGIAPARKAVTMRQEELKDRWLEHNVNFTGVAYSVERQEALKDAQLGIFTASNNPKVAAIQTQESLKDIWLERASTIAISYSVERQEALKDAWLGRFAQ